LDRIAVVPASDRRDLFTEGAGRLGMNPAIVEKDFWVCWILKLLFSVPQLKDQMVFKGGTSLSKVYGLIDRFSEDIDLILDWRLLGYGLYELGGRESPAVSRTRQIRFNQEMNAKAARYIRETLLGQLNQAFAAVPKVAAEIDPNDPHTVTVSYPAAFSADYIRPQVRLEIGPLASRVPSSSRTIRSYAAEASPRAFIDPICAVVVLGAERTFWEKATILHQEAHRSVAIPARYSRHYYDMYKLANSPIKTSALSDLGLLKDVVQFKERFYYSSWARYDLAQPGTFRLVPPPSQTSALARDYRAMHDMFNREPPEFGVIMEGLATLESEINDLESAESG
jgi:hypothetical protein